ncbi:hypothetical protein NA57DRAFT_72491 [Rhizodiscina lignyota]|uniref:Transcription factor domain-containing protein n=1 Tax=Rhizodiscina lignyota TaxID=1504668 RepID=A0A9P4ISM6_9PEZI|nr:hypothetical protein NA57DRAFT_72491 [Rhizodiscina lignyota]
MQELEEETSALRRELQVVIPPAPPHVQITRISEPTESRSIDGIDLGPAIIDHAFKLFFRDFHPLLPVLDPTVTPNVLYGKSPVLFWVVVSIGSRKHLVFPRLIDALSPRVSSLVLSSLSSRTNPLESIKAILLLLEWPFPSTSYRKDPSFVLSGALIHMAMQNGLHTPSILCIEIQKLGAESSFFDPSDIERAKLWAYVVVLYQRTCTGGGHPALWSVDTYTEQDQFKRILPQLPAELQLQLQLATIMSRAQRTFVQFGLPKLSSQQERTLDSVLQMVTTQLDTVESRASSACRLEVAAMHFFKSSEALDVQACQFIFDTIVKVYEFIRDQEKAHKLSSFCPNSVISAVMMGQALMLRIHKGPMAAYVDQERGSALFHAIVSFIKAVALEHGDKPTKVVSFSEQMWGSSKAFKNADGSLDLALRVRNRLSISLVHDAIIRWREEFLTPDRPVDLQQHTASILPANAAAHSDPIAPNIGQDDFAATLGTEAAMMPMNGLFGDFCFDLDDLWRTPDWQ